MFLRDGQGKAVLRAWILSYHKPNGEEGRASWTRTQPPSSLNSASPRCDADKLCHRVRVIVDWLGVRWEIGEHIL